MPAPPRRPLLLAGLAVAMAGAGAWPTAWAQGSPGAAELRLGALFPLSGPLALLGDESFRGLEMAVDERNAAGGLLSRRLRLLRADVPDAAHAQAEARRLSAQGPERPTALFGTYSTALALAATQAAELQGMPYFELGANGDQLTERGFRQIFRSAPRASDLARLAVDAIPQVIAPLQETAPEALRIAILHDDGPNGQAMAELLEARLQEAKLNLVEKAGHPPQPAEIAVGMRRVRGAGAQILLHVGQQDDAAHLFRAMREAAWWPRMVVGVGGGYALRETEQSAGAGLDGTMLVDLPHGEIAERFAPGARSFAEAYRRRYGADPRSGHSMASYAGARVFLDALQHAGGAGDAARLRAAVLATDLPDGSLANGWGVRFDDRGQNLRARPILMQWREGRLRAVHPPEAEVGTPRPRLLYATD